MIGIKKIDPRRLLGVRIALGGAKIGEKAGTKPDVFGRRPSRATADRAASSIRLRSKIGEKAGTKSIV